MEIVKFSARTRQRRPSDRYLHTPIWEMETRRESFPAVIICPGGAYFFVLPSGRSDPVAMPFLGPGATRCSSSTTPWGKRPRASAR